MPAERSCLRMNRFLDALTAAGLSPATGEGFKPMPFILGGIGLLVILILVAVMILERKQKKQDGQNPPTPPTPSPEMSEGDGEKTEN